MKYVKKDGKEHISESNAGEVFQGNMVFASERQMNFGETSRKDDMVSLFYLLIFMLNDQSLWVANDPVKDKHGIEKVFTSIKNWK